MTACGRTRNNVKQSRDESRARNTNTAAGRRSWSHVWRCESRSSRACRAVVQLGEILTLAPRPLISQRQNRLLVRRSAQVQQEGREGDVSSNFSSSDFIVGSKISATQYIKRTLRACVWNEFSQTFQIHSLIPNSPSKFIPQIHLHSLIEIPSNQRCFDLRAFSFP